jgi:sugar (pentulose or hexulose) kinase
MNNLVIGLDIGTSSLKLVVLNCQTKQIELNISKSTQECRISNEIKSFNEQNVAGIMGLVEELFKEIPETLKESVKAIQICGQVNILSLN